MLRQSRGAAWISNVQDWPWPARPARPALHVDVQILPVSGTKAGNKRVMCSCDSGIVCRRRDNYVLISNKHFRGVIEWVGLACRWELGLYISSGVQDMLWGCRRSEQFATATSDVRKAELVRYFWNTR